MRLTKAGKRVTVPLHRSLAVGTLQSVLHQAGLTIEALLELLQAFVKGKTMVKELWQTNRMRVHIENSLRIHRKFAGFWEPLRHGSPLIEGR